MTNTKPIILVPLDERPVNTRYPEMLAQIGGAELTLPPLEMRGFARTPADLVALDRWLEGAVEVGASAAIVSCDFYGYGNLINARISQSSAAETLSRMTRLAKINETCPVHVFSLITRVANANDCVEEPLYWKEWGTRMYRFAHLAHRAEKGSLTDDESAELGSLRDTIPSELRTDWMTRRLRNHTVNLGLFDMAARDQIASLLLTSDDTSPYGFSSRERDWLLAWPELVGEKLAAKVQAYPGADEVGSALVARLINESQGRSPKVWIDYAFPGDRLLVAPYEDRPADQTVRGQIAACGCQVAESASDADFILAVVPPSPRRTDYRPEFYEPDRAERTTVYDAFLARIAEYQHVGKPVALADIAYPNGADPLFAERLLAHDAHDVQVGNLAAYGAWNTAGNTLGVVVAQSALSIYTVSPQEKQAQKLFLAHRFLEDYGYQTVIRREARAESDLLWGHREPDPGNDAQQATLSQFIEARLNEVLMRLQAAGVGDGVDIVPGSTRLPWRRTFEVDFVVK